MKRRRITTRIFVLTAVIGSVLIMSMVIAFSLWSSRQTLSATDDAVSAVSAFYLEAMADRRAKTISNLINNNFDEMEKAVEFLAGEEIETREELRNTIGKIKSLLTLKHFAVVDEDNVVYTQYTTYTGGSRHAFLAKEQMSDRNISTVSIYGSSRQLCLAIPTSGFSVMGKRIKACFIQFDVQDIVDLLAFDDQGRTYFGLYSGIGDNLSDTELGSVIARRNIFEAIKEFVPDEVLKEHRANFAEGAAGSVTFNANGNVETLSYVPVEGTDWEMAVFILESVIDERIRDISDKNIAASRKQILFTLTAVLLLAAVLLLQFRALSRERLEAEKETSRTFRNMATTDSMTGVRNKHAYSEFEASCNKQIQDNQLQKLAVVVCDINGLKHVNDTQGHAAGDKLIKDACSMICECFKRGSVFRIGGDEFVVLLVGDGCDTMNEAVCEINRRSEANIPGNGVVVSVGCSVLEQDDRQVHDVFERADQMMYERKQELKKMGAKTRDS